MTNSWRTVWPNTPPTASKSKPQTPSTARRLCVPIAGGDTISLRRADPEATAERSSAREATLARCRRSRLSGGCWLFRFRPMQVLWLATNRQPAFSNRFAATSTPATRYVLVSSQARRKSICPAAVRPTGRPAWSAAERHSVAPSRNGTCRCWPARTTVTVTTSPGCLTSMASRKSSAVLIGRPSTATIRSAAARSTD